MIVLIFNLIFYPLFVTVTAGMFLFFFIPMFALRAVAGERVAMKALRTLICVYGWIVIKGLTFPFVRIDFEDYEPQRKEACVYICNHRSASDAFLMALLNRELIQVVNNWPFRIPIIGWIAERAGYLSVRSMPFEVFSERATRLLKQGVSVVAFPEGSRSTGTELLQFNGAAFRVAQNAGVPLVPLCISGNDRIPEKGTNRFHSGKIRVHKLKALEWAAFRNEPPFHFKNKVREILQAEFNRMQAM